MAVRYNRAMAITMTEAQYDQLVGLARQGLSGNDAQRELDKVLVQIEEANGITRYLLWVRWQEVGQIHPINEFFPAGWPPTQEVKIERLNTPISRSFVEETVTARSINPASILVTEDPGKELGWSTLDQYFP